METEPATELAKQYNGWNTQLKPSIEPITIAMKPFSETNTVENIIKHGVGGFNINECRIPHNEPLKTTLRTENGNIWNEKTTGLRNNPSNMASADPQGRYPSNCIHDGSDEVVNLFPHTKSGKMNNNHTRHTDGSPNGIYGKFNIEHPLSETYGDEGSASRFFYCAKASKSERNLGLSGFNGTSISNIHVSVKPIKLMEYLVKLITNENMIVLDPFMGSGTTGIACKNLNRSFIGVELEEDYFEIAEKRIETAHLHLDSKKDKQKIKKVNLEDFSNYY
jgi:site-specific DNA-methyltransferase (adenine-specific)